MYAVQTPVRAFEGCRAWMISIRFVSGGTAFESVRAVAKKGLDTSTWHEEWRVRPRQHMTADTAVTVINYDGDSCRLLGNRHRDS